VTPTLALTGTTLDYNIGAGATNVITSASITDTDSANMSSATITITAGVQAGDTLSVGTPGGLSVSYSSPTLTLTGSASKAVYQTALGSVKFTTSSSSTTDRTLSWTVTDDVTNNTSGAQTSTIKSGALALATGNIGTHAEKNTSISFSYTTPAGTNRVLVVAVAVDGTTVSSVTFNTTTLLSPLDAQSTATPHVELWYAVNPPASTTANIVVGLGANKDAVIGAFTFTNANQTSPFRDHKVNTGTSTTASVSSISTGANDIVLDVVGEANTSTTLTADPSQAPRVNLTSGSNKVHGAMSTKTNATSMSWTLSGASQLWAIGAGSVQP